MLVVCKARLTCFNSIKVRLELLMLKTQRLPYWGFNSIKVRLELLLHIAKRSPFRFQFHKGTIRTGYFFVLDSIIPRFNSIKVRLERLMDYEGYYKYQSFNSIKVRLERNLPFVEACLLVVVSIP